MVNSRHPCFFHIFSPNLSSHRLKIPLGFIKHMENRTSGLVSLMGPSGNIWAVDLIKNNNDDHDHDDNDMFLDNGWSTFVSDHWLESGDLLVFRYDGDLGFDVQVFDDNACEKEAAFHSKCTQDHSLFERIVGYKRKRRVEDVAFSVKRIKEGYFESDSECVDKNWEAGFSNNELIACKANCKDSLRNETKECGSVPKESYLSAKSKASNEKPGFETMATTRRRTGKDNDLILQERSQMSVFSEREKIVAQSFTSCFPFFVRIMKRFNVSGSYTLNIPYQFSTAHLPNCKTEIVLRTIKGGCWTVNSVPTTRVHTSHTLCGGWMTFVRQNDITLGDVCIFELVRKLELRVFLLRVGKESGDDPTGKEASNGVKVGCAAKPETFRKKSRKNSIKVHSNLSKKSEICDKRGSKKSQPAPFSSHTYCNVKQENPQSGKNIEAEMDSQAGSGLRMIVALDEKKAAKGFISGFPNFVRIMRKFNVSGSYTLKIPHQFSAAYLPNFKTEIVLRNLQGKCWTVNSVPDSKGRKVHTFCGGWMAFVRDNDVKMGDICIFELVRKCEMLVHISGVGGNIHQNQGGKPASNELHLGEFSTKHTLMRHAVSLL